MTIIENVKGILAELPDNVTLVAAAKNRTPEEILDAISAGVKIIGGNYLQESETAYKTIGNKVKWHFIGHLQKNKVKKTVSLFDMIETVDSIELAQEIDNRSSQIGKVMPILIEINSGRERQKSGVLPEDAEKLIRDISKLKNIKILGLMTMGPQYGNPEDCRPLFKETKKLFEKIKNSSLHNVDIKYLSMGMTNSYKVAMEEGANIIRIGTGIFGERN